MNRRKFLRFGGLISASPVVVGVGGFAGQEQPQPDELPRFEVNQILTVESLNALVERINELDKKNWENKRWS